jgi:hypothetical protein
LYGEQAERLRAMMKMRARVALCLSVAVVSALCLAAALMTLRGEHARAQAAEVQPAQPDNGIKPELKPAPSTPLAEKKAELGDDKTWRPEWDAVIEKALPDDLLSQEVTRDVKSFCPRFPEMSEADKRAYWAYFFQALSGAEAGLKATSNVQHTEPEVAVKDGVSHRMVRSEGLLQLTYEDANRYGCDFDWDNDKQLKEHDPDKTILQPDNNLLCGVKILEKQLVDQKKPLLSKTSYWSTLRPGWPGYRVFVQQMANVPEACGHKRMGKRGSRTDARNSLEAGH